MSETGENADLQQEGSLSGGVDRASEDAELLAALETLRRVVNRPKRAPRGTNDVWGWSTGQEHALEPGTEPREQVVERIRKSYLAGDGSAPAERQANEVAVLETIAHVIDAMKDRPEYAQHDLKRIVKALEAVVQDKVGPGDAPPEPSKMLIGPGAKSSRQIAEELAQPALNPEEETLDYAYIVSDHPKIAELVQEHGLTTVWNELLRLRFDLPSKNEEIASTLCKVALALYGDDLYPNIPVLPPPKMYVDEKGEPVMYNQSRSTDIFPLELYWSDTQINEKRETLSQLEARMDKSGRRADYDMVFGFGNDFATLARVVGKRAMWLELMRIRYGAWPKDLQLHEDIKDMATTTPGLLDIPRGEEAVPPRLIAELRNDVAKIMRGAMTLREHNLRARQQRHHLESEAGGQYVRVAPWNTYIPKQALQTNPGLTTSDQANSADAQAKKPEGNQDDNALHALETLDSIGRIAEEGLPAPAAGILADALRLAANQIEQQTGIAEAANTGSSAPAKKTSGAEKVEKTFEEGFTITYTEGHRASLTFAPVPERVYYRELLTYAERENYSRYKRNWSQGRDFTNTYMTEYRDGLQKETWGGKNGATSFLNRDLSWNDLHPAGLNSSNPYYPFPKEYIEYALAVRTTYDQTYKMFEETQKISAEGPVARLKQVWKDHADGVENRLWSAWQLYYCRLRFTTLLEHSRLVKKTGTKAGPVADWPTFNHLKDMELPRDRSYFDVVATNDKG